MQTVYLIMKSILIPIVGANQHSHLSEDQDGFVNMIQVSMAVDRMQPPAVAPKGKAKTADADGATGSTAQAVQAIDTAADVSAKAILDAAALTQTNPKTVQGVVEKEVNVDTEVEKRAHRKYCFVVN